MEGKKKKMDYLPLSVSITPHSLLLCHPFLLFALSQRGRSRDSKKEDEEMKREGQMKREMEREREGRMG